MACVKNILNLGAGIQSTTVLLMSCRGELPKLDCAIFADTNWESKATYTHLEWLKTESAKCNIPIHIVSDGNIREDGLRSKIRGHKQDGDRWVSLPLFILNADGSRGQIKRQCTFEYKISPIQKFIKRELLGLKPYQRTPKELVIDQWYGISTDEARRIRALSDLWRRNVYPLVNIPEDYLKMPMSRMDCILWLKRNYPNIVVPRSSCLGCPYHSNSEWRTIKANTDEWQDVIEFDRAIRDCDKLDGKAFLHNKRIPLFEINLDIPEDHGQKNLFERECYGMCGV